MSVWDSFFRLDVLDISFYDNISAQKATIFANSKNQVEFAIKVKVVDKDNKPLDIPDNELINNIYLVRYADGSKDLAPWSATSIKNEYAKVVAWDTQLVDTKTETYAGEKVVKFYLSGSEANSSIDISAGIYIPGVGDFNSSQNGTSTRNGPRGEIGTPFRNPVSKHVNTIQPIDYSKPEEVDVKNMPGSIGDFHTEVSDVHITLVRGPGLNTNWYTGVSSRARFTIHAKRPGYQFNVINPQRNNANLSTCNFPVKPDMVRDVGGNNFDVQFVFINREIYGLKQNSNFLFEINVGNGTSAYLYKYIIGPNDSRHWFTKNIEANCINIDICNHRVPWSNMRAYQWGDDGRVIKVDVTDNYGNSGVITIQSILHDNERWPGLFVNGQ